MVQNMDAQFSLRVDQHVERLKNHTLRQIEAEVTAKRLAWFDQHYPARGESASPSPRRAFELLFFEYMGLTPEDVPVLSETDNEIVWASYNPCPTLEACRKLGLDTRLVCRAAYEKSTQALISRLDPQLRFLRSYQEIRPQADFCKEWIERVDFAAMMRLAIKEARQSRWEGNKGYGAVVALGQRVLSQAHDTASTMNDPSQHAEVNAIRQAVQVLGDSNLSGAILFSTCEPCPMCSSLAVWANLTTVVYGASIAETARLGKSRILVNAQEIVEKSPIMIEIIGGVLADECVKLYE
jgi:tRNA(adenine34) deaminase